MNEDEIKVSLRMEVHVVRKDYPVFSIPLTKTYLYTYIEDTNRNKMNEVYSDTTTCPNGWAVKELKYCIRNGEKIYLGATTKNPPGNNYQFETVDFYEIERFENDSDTIRFVKTFTIYE
ncbi:MAG: hypothetical protein JW995_02355 [Melioribacteraceae bacterium]|nr:hypothetical protein [Melioribacteraceae bacterium]